MKAWTKFINSCEMARMSETQQPGFKNYQVQTNPTTGLKLDEFGGGSANRHSITDGMTNLMRLTTIGMTKMGLTRMLQSFGTLSWNEMSSFN